MVTTIIKYIGESLKSTVPFLSEVHAPVRRLVTGVIYKGDGPEKEPISINDQEGKALYIRQAATEQVTEGPPKSSCGKNYLISARCRLVFYCFTNYDLSSDKIKSVLSTELANINFRQYKGTSSNIKVSNNGYSDDFEAIFQQETGKTYNGDEWPIIIAIDFTLNYEDVNCEPCDIGEDEYSPIEFPAGADPCKKQPFCEAVAECAVIVALQEETASLQEQINNLPPGGLTCDDLPNCQTIIDLQTAIDELETQIETVIDDITTLQTDVDNVETQLSQLITDFTTLQTNLSNHISDINNPHQTTLEQARTADNFFSGEVDMNSNRLRNLPVPTNADEATNKAYVDGLIDSTLKAAEFYNPNITNLFPTTYGGDPIKKGDTFRLQAGTMNGVVVSNEDLAIADVDNPGQTVANWQILESNREQATETVMGIAKIVTQAIIEDEFTSNNTDIVTAQKFWFGILRFLKLAWTWDLKQTFTAKPRFNAVNASEYLKTDASKDLTSVSAIPATDITEDSTHCFATDSEKTTWNLKQDAITYLKITTGNQISNSAVLANITGLKFTGLVNTRYRVQGVICHGQTNNQGLVLAFTCPALASFYIRGYGNGTSLDLVKGIYSTVSGTPTAPLNTQAVSQGASIFNGEISFGANGGDFDFQFARAGALGTATVYQLGTNIEIVKLN